jgi:hypothetical protein
MRERNRELNRRRKRQDKRRKLRAKLASVGSDADRQAIEAKIRKTYPKYTPGE